MMCSFAALDDAALDVVKTVEKEIGETVLAYDCFASKTISEESLEKIRTAEKKLCRTLIAVKTEH